MEFPLCLYWPNEGIVIDLDHLTDVATDYCLAGAAESSEWDPPWTVIRWRAKQLGEWNTSIVELKQALDLHGADETVG